METENSATLKSRERDKSTELEIKHMSSRSMHGHVNIYKGENGLLRYSLNLCYAGECVSVERIMLSGHWGNITDVVKDEIREILRAVRMDSFVIKEVRH